MFQKDIKDGIRSVAVSNPDGEWIVRKVYFCLPSVVG